MCSITDKTWTFFLVTPDFESLQELEFAHGVRQMFEFIVWQVQNLSGKQNKNKDKTDKVMISFTCPKELGVESLILRNTDLEHNYINLHSHPLQIISVMCLVGE